jgi:hypothetical protein
MPTPITETTFTFTYPIADELYSTSNSLNRTATASYTGPDRVWVFVDAETGDYDPVDRILTTRDEGGSVPVPVGKRRVEINAIDDPMILGIFHPHHCTVQDQTVVSEDLPDGTTLTYNGTATVDETYHVTDFAHDGTKWVMPAFRAPDQTWDDIISVRNGLLLASDGKISPDQPESIKAPWVAYRQALRNIPDTFGKGTENEVLAWKISMPLMPGDN